MMTIHYSSSFLECEAHEEGADDSKEINSEDKHALTPNPTLLVR